MIVRWLNPVMLLGGAAWVYNYNETHAASTVSFPFMDIVVGPSRHDQGEATVYLFATLGVLTLIQATYRTFAGRQQPSEEE